jgi:two-component system, OmpR family, KDP operon response regulator KdpE
MDGASQHIQKETKTCYGTDLDAESTTNHYRVLLVEDDPDSSMLLKRLLILSGFDVTSANNGIEGLKKTEQYHPDIALLDLMMPDMDGWEMLKQLRQVSSMPVIMITALNQSENVVNALKMGADDYITKPFHNTEVIERIRAVLRRITKPEDQSITFEKIGLHINFNICEVIYKKKMLELTPKEFAVLASLIRHAPAVVTYETLKLEVWGEALPSFQNRVKFLVFALRQKIAEIDPDFELITTVGRRGYRLQIE